MLQILLNYDDNDEILEEWKQASDMKNKIKFEIYCYGVPSAVDQGLWLDKQNLD